MMYPSNVEEMSGVHRYTKTTIPQKYFYSEMIFWDTQVQISDKPRHHNYYGDQKKIKTSREKLSKNKLD